ncbi:MAG: hypothetical protein ACOH1Y_16560 [Propionicimonas sp.]
MSGVSPAVIAVIILAMVLMVALWVVWVRAIWAFVKIGLFFATAGSGALLAVWVWHVVRPA